MTENKADQEKECGQYSSATAVWADGVREGVGYSSKNLISSRMLRMKLKVFNQGSIKP